MAKSNPFQAPSSPVRASKTPVQRLRTVRSVAGVVALLLLVGGVLFTVIGMMQAFSSLAATESVRPTQLADDIGVSMLGTVIGIPLAGVALGIRVWASMRLRRSRTAEREALDRADTTQLRS